MPPHNDHFKNNRPGHPKARGHHPPPHGPGHHHPPHFDADFETTEGFYRQILELQAMGADDKDLHDLIDSETEMLNGRNAARADTAVDPGRAVGALDRARMILRNARTAEEGWMTDMAGKDVLVVAEFPPHLLDRMLRSGVNITQIHPPTPEGDTPPHFYHLSRRGLRGVIDFKALAETAVEMLLFEGVRHSGLVYVSPLVPVTIRMFPDVPVAMLDAEHRAPHMSVAIADKSFARIPTFD